MPVPEQTPVATFTGNGVTTDFSFAWGASAAAHVVAEVDSLELVQGVDYTVLSIGDAGGTVRILPAPTDGADVTVFRRTPLERVDIDYQEAGPFRAETVDLDFNTVWRALQDLFYRYSLVPALPTGSSLAGSLSLPVPGAGKFLRWSHDGTRLEAVDVESEASVSTLRADLSDAVSPAEGAALVSFSAVLAYAENTTGWALRSVGGGTNVLRYMPVSEWPALLAGTSTRDCATELAAAIAAEDHLFFPCWVPVNSTVVLRSGITLSGVDRARSGVKGLANTFSLLSDNNAALSNVTIRDMGFDGGSAGTANRGLLFDADTANQAQNVRIERCRFSNLFRGAELDRVAGLEFVDCAAGGLTSSLLYVGETPATGRSSKVNVRGARVTGGDIVDILGGGNIVVSHADGVTISDVELDGTGASSGAVNLFHAVYARSCTDVRIAGIRARDHRRGAVIHVYADTGSGEPTSKNVHISDVIVSQQKHYAALRIDAVDGLTLRGVRANEGATQALYLTNITDLTVQDLSGRNNNRDRLTGTTNALVKAENIVRANFANVIGIDDDTGNGEYGQGTLFTLTGTNSDIQWENVQMRFPTGGAIGYYGIDVASGTLTRFSVRGWMQDGANPFNEGGTATDGAFANIVMVNTGVSDLLTFAQLHKFQCRDVRISGSAWPYESDGWFITAKLSDQPASGDWRVGDTVWRTAPAAGFTHGWRCVTTGTPGTWKAMASLAS